MTFATDCFGRVLLAAVCLGGIGSLSHAQVNDAAPTGTTSTNAAPRTLAEATAQAANSSGGQTDIVARLDSPRVTNILPWQEQPISTPKNPLTISALDGSLTPTDRDRLAYETQYSSFLNQTTTDPSSNRP